MAHGTNYSQLLPVRDISVPLSLRHHLGATVSTFIVSALGHLGTDVSAPVYGL